MMGDLISRQDAIKAAVSAAEASKTPQGAAHAAAQALRDLPAAGGWQPIETAPKDGTEILLSRQGRIVVGRWDEDKYASKPAPYWTDDNERHVGKLSNRKVAPDGWQPLPSPVSNHEGE